MSEGTTESCIFLILNLTNKSLPQIIATIYLTMYTYVHIIYISLYINKMNDTRDRREELIILCYGKVHALSVKQYNII